VGIGEGESVGGGEMERKNAVEETDQTGSGAASSELLSRPSELPRHQPHLPPSPPPTSLHHQPLFSSSFFFLKLYFLTVSLD
jgi:hypothetical protein